MAQSPAVAEQPAPVTKKYSVAQAWTPALAKGKLPNDRGHVPVVRTFLHHYSKLTPPLRIEEAVFVIHLMSHKWGDAAPWPSYATIAGYMGVDAKTVRRYAQSLERKRYLRRQPRKARTNLFDLRPLFRALEAEVFGKVMTPGLL